MEKVKKQRIGFLKNEEMMLLHDLNDKC
jgi:hypothetical protein